MRGAIGALLLAAACSSSGEEQATRTFVNKEQHYSLEAPQDWNVSRVRGASQFASPHAAKHTIVVRVADRPRTLGENKPATDAALETVAEDVLRNLPRATIASRLVVSGAELPGVLFDVTFSPHTTTTRYHRTHALLLGKQHLYHVIYSAPAGEPINWDAYNTILHSLNEEG